MLKINHSHHFSLPEFNLPGGSMQLSPVPIDDNDELSRSIENDVVDHDNAWQLVERPDPDSLTRFWTTVEADVAQDPEWFSFSAD